MRKLVVITGLLLAGSIAVAEPRGGGGGNRFGWALYGGFAMPNNESNSTGTFTGFSGLAFGMGLDFRVAPRMSVGLDILYVTKGYIREEGGSQTRYSLNFVEFPVQLKFIPVPNLIFHGGPYLSALVVSAVADGNGNSTSVKGQFSNDYGLSFGVWIGFSASPALSVGIDTRYDVGLADIQNDNFPNDYIRTRALISMATMVIGL